MKVLESIIIHRGITSKLVLSFILIIGLLEGILLIETFYGDPTIYLIYARNMAKGDFFSFNPGEFSSGSTSPLWAAILSIAFLFPASVHLAKIISLIATLLAIYATYSMSSLISKSRIGSAAVSSITLYFVALAGLLMYESSLIILFVSILVAFTYKILQGKDKTPNSNVWCLALAWSAIPLIRPDAFVAVFIDVLVLAFVFARHKRSLLLVLLAFFFSLIPSILYFGYSKITLGSFAVSSYSRAFALKEQAKSIFGISYSLTPLRVFFRVPLLMGIPVGLWAWEKSKKEDRTKQVLGVLSVLVLGGYLFLLSLVSPVTVTSDVERYMLPILPFIVLWISIGIGELWNIAAERKHFITMFSILLLVGLVPTTMLTEQVMRARSYKITFDIITEEKIIKYLNSIATPNATILSYEVQNRYHLRPDLKVLSLDGITDGKVAPYLSSGDMSSFLWKYQPKYWLANDAVFYRRFLLTSILRRVVEKTGKMEGSSIEIDGITFTNIYQRREPMVEGFAGYRQLYKLTYTWR